MKVDTNELLSVFERLLPYTDEEKGIHWYEFTREDGLSVELMISIYEELACLSVSKGEELTITSLVFEVCSAINVLDEDRKCLEVLSGVGNDRCLVTLNSNTILEMKLK